MMAMTMMKAMLMMHDDVVGVALEMLLNSYCTTLGRDREVGGKMRGIRMVTPLRCFEMLGCGLHLVRLNR